MISLGKAAEIFEMFSIRAEYYGEEKISFSGFEVYLNGCSSWIPILFPLVIM